MITFSYFYGEEERSERRNTSGELFNVKFWERVSGGEEETHAAILHLADGNTARCEYFPPYPDGFLSLAATTEGYLYLLKAGKFASESDEDAEFMTSYERERAAFYYSVCRSLPLSDIEALFELNPSIAREYDDNPYCLLRYGKGTHGEIPFANFLSLYQLAKIPTFKARLTELKECARYVLEKNESKGNTCMELEDFEKKFRDVLSKGPRPIKDEYKPRAVVLYFSENFHIASDGKKYYVSKEETYENEAYIKEEVQRCLGRDEVFGRYDISAASRDALSPEQTAGALGCIKGRGSVSILTGGPGTGKTRVIAAIAEGITSSYPGIKVRFLSPTGMAAKRMEEQMSKEYPQLSGIDIMTIHKFLGYGNPFRSEELKKNIEESGLIIIDEASMLDVFIFAQLLKAVDLENTKIVLVGDINQLPSIGAGCVMSDLEKLGVPVFKLSVNYRAGEGAVIVKNANSIMDGRPVFEENEYFEVVNIGESGFVRAAMENGLSKTTRIISPYRKAEINGSGEAIGALVKRAKFSEKKGNSYELGVKSSEQRAYEPEEGDFVIITKTNYKDGYVNGDTGVVLSRSPFYCEVCVGKNTAGGNITKTVPIKDLTLGYAISVHKSQGSEYEDVVIVIPKASDFVTRRMLYTAMTRAKRRIKIYAHPIDLLKTALNARDEKRLTHTQLFGAEW